LEVVLKLQFVGEGKSLPLFFNLTRPVGKGYASAPADDVSFVQFCIAASVSPSSANPPPPELIPAMVRVQVSGTTDADTLAAIEAMQQFRRTRFGPKFEDLVPELRPPGRNGLDLASGRQAPALHQGPRRCDPQRAVGSDPRVSGARAAEIFSKPG
jgi:hypothetical protein